MARQGLPPTFHDSSPIANGLAVRRDALAFFQKLANEAGDVAHFELLDRVVYLVLRPSIVREILAAGEDQFTKWSGSKATRVIFGEGLLSSQGERHRKVRRATSPALHQQRLSEYAVKIGEVTERRMRQWPEDEPFDFAREFAVLTLEVVSEALFHTPLRHGPELIDALQNMQRFHESFGTSVDDDRTFLTENARINEIIHEMLQERAASGESQDDLLTMILSTEAESSGISDDVVQEARSFFLAGHVTTALTLASAVWLLTSDPAEQTRLQTEIDGAMGDRSPTFADLPRLDFLEPILLETLRLYPPVWVLGREAMRDFQAEGFQFPKGAMIVILPCLLHRDPRYFTDPDEFQPARWANNARAQLPRGLYLPFSAGPRNCVGERFAMMEATLVLAQVLQRWRFASAPDHPVRWERHAILSLPNGIWLRASRRDPARAET